MSVPAAARGRGAGRSRDARPARPRIPLRTAQFAACMLLLIQYLLGMAVNLFVTVPRHHPGAGARNYFAGLASGLEGAIPHSSAWLAVHTALGLALAAAAIAVAVAAFRSAGRTAAVTSIVGALAIVGAGFNGASFLNYGHDFSSMIMAGLFAVALGSYLTGLYAGRGTSDAEASPAGLRRGR